jgi:hypothetical protein
METLLQLLRQQVLLERHRQLVSERHLRLALEARPEALDRALLVPRLEPAPLPRLLVSQPPLLVLVGVLLELLEEPLLVVVNKPRPKTIREQEILRMLPPKTRTVERCSLPCLFFTQSQLCQRTRIGRSRSFDFKTT